MKQQSLVDRTIGSEFRLCLCLSQSSSIDVSARSFHAASSSRFGVPTKSPVAAVGNGHGWVMKRRCLDLGQKPPSGSFNPSECKILMPHRIIWSWYTGRWWVCCLYSSKNDSDKTNKKEKKMLHSVQRVGGWAGLQPVQASPNVTHTTLFTNLVVQNREITNLTK